MNELLKFSGSSGCQTEKKAGRRTTWCVRKGKIHTCTLGRAVRLRRLSTVTDGWLAAVVEVTWLMVMSPEVSAMKYWMLAVIIETLDKGDIINSKNILSIQFFYKKLNFLAKDGLLTWNMLSKLILMIQLLNSKFA